MSRHPDQRSVPKTILLVEDEVIVAMATRHGLESTGYRVELAHNGEDAVRLAVENPEINLVLMDIDLGPGIDGTEAAQRILDARNLPIVFLSSHAEKELVDKVRGITRYGYVIKNSGDFVLNASLEMAFELFEANRREQEQAARLGAIVQAQPDRMFVVNVDGTFREAYTPHHASLAIPGDLISGAHLRDVFGEQEAERHMAAYRACVETGEFQSFEYEMDSGTNPRQFEARISKLDDRTVLAIVREITESRRMEDELNRLVTLHRVIVNVSTTCINLPSDAIPEAIRSALAAMAQAIGADRAYVFDYDFERQIAINRFEWCSPGTEPQIDRLQSLPLREIEAGVTRHREGSPHHIPVVADLPEGTLRDVLEPQGIQSMLAVPMLSDGACIGSVGFDFVAEPHNFSHEESTLLTVFAELLVNLREREAAEATIEALLSEKELLLTEVHHRVKNNMLSVSSLLSLQAATAESAEAAAALTEARSRMQSMAVLYDRLYRSENLREMPIGEYLAPLAREILATHSRSESVSLEIEICDAILPVSLLAGIGMIVNEAISNTIKHAFPGRAGGRITVAAVRAEDRLEITIEDDGVGLPDGVDLGKSEGFGLQLIESLASQHGLQVRLERSGGTRFVLGVDGAY